MHDYDRRRAASAKETEFTNQYWPLEVTKILERALKEQDTTLAKFEARQVNDNVISARGTTADGRTFEGEVTVFLKGENLYTTTKLRLEGSVDMGPMPESLSKVLAVISTLADKTLEVLGKNQLGFRYGHYRTALQTKLELWGRGEPVDKRDLRLHLQHLDKDLKDRLFDGRLKMLTPENLEILKPLFVATRKAIAAAVRDLK